MPGKVDAIPAKDILDEARTVEPRSRGLATITVTGAHITLCGGEHLRRAGRPSASGRARGARRFRPARRCGADVTPWPPRVATTAMGPRVALTAARKAWKETRTCADSTLGTPRQERQRASDQFHGHLPLRTTGAPYAGAVPISAAQPGLDQKQTPPAGIARTPVGPCQHQPVLGAGHPHIE